MKQHFGAAAHAALQLGAMAQSPLRGGLRRSSTRRMPSQPLRLYGCFRHGHSLQTSYHLRGSAALQRHSRLPDWARFHCRQPTSHSQCCTLESPLKTTLLHPVAEPVHGDLSANDQAHEDKGLTSVECPGGRVGTGAMKPLPSARTGKEGQKRPVASLPKSQGRSHILALGLKHCKGFALSARPGCFGTVFHTKAKHSKNQLPLRTDCRGARTRRQRTSPGWASWGWRP